MNRHSKWKQFGVFYLPFVRDTYFLTVIMLEKVEKSKQDTPLLASHILKL